VAPPALSAVSFTGLAWASGEVNPTQSFTCFSGVVKLTFSVALQNSAAKQSSTAWLPERAKPGVAA
jgi:hypothetical protein